MKEIISNYDIAWERLKLKKNGNDKIIKLVIFISFLKCGVINIGNKYKIIIF